MRLPRIWVNSSPLPSHAGPSVVVPYGPSICSKFQLNASPRRAAGNDASAVLRMAGLDCIPRAGGVKPQDRPPPPSFPLPHHPSFPRTETFAQPVIPAQGDLCATVIPAQGDLCTTVLPATGDLAQPSFPRRETFAQPSFPRRETFAQPSFPRRETFAQPSFPRRETFEQPSFPRRRTFAQPSFPRRRESRFGGSPLGMLAISATLSPKGGVTQRSPNAGIHPRAQCTVPTRKQYVTLAFQFR